MVEKESDVVTDVNVGLECCDECGRDIVKAQRVENGHRYCATCYQRCFKRRNCPGCGMFKRLLVGNPDAECKTCVAAKPCIRCDRRGRPVGKLLPQGPVCNACYPYFREPKVCSACHTLTRRYSTQNGASEVLCERCTGPAFKTCSRCHLPRSGTLGADGAWVCTKCETLPDQICERCATPMPAGRGQACQACYWKDRCERTGAQLQELFSSAKVRQAFGAYVTWAIAEVDHKRLSLTLSKHADFFDVLDQHPDRLWDAEFLLEAFGTPKLRKYELPVRWMQQERAVTLNPAAKALSADHLRIHALMQRAPQNSQGFEVLQAFHDTLQARVALGQLKSRSMRFALQPAFNLLQVTVPPWQVLPDQQAMNVMLSKTPGQKSAVSTFIAFLSKRYGVQLSVPKKLPTVAAVRNRKLGQQLAQLSHAEIRDETFTRQWALVALQYFHKLTLAQAQDLLKNGTHATLSDGNEFCLAAERYWIPAPPSMSPRTA